jgi:hypothetical protein
MEKEIEMNTFLYSRKGTLILAILFGAALLIGACTPTAGQQVMPTDIPTPPNGSHSTPVDDTPEGPLAATVELPDRSHCLFAGQGATLAFGGQRVNYRCVVPGGADVVLLDWPTQQNGVWTITQATIGHNDEGFFLDDSDAISFEITEVELEDDVRCVRADHPENVDGQPVAFTCETDGDVEFGLLGELVQEGEAWSAERATLVRNGDDLSLGETTMAPISLLVGREPATATTPPAAQTPVDQLTEDILKNGRYELPDLGTVVLTDGQFEEQYGEGATMVNKAGFIQAALGDLDGDEADDAVLGLCGIAVEVEPLSIWWR